MAPAPGNHECPNNVSMTGEAGYGPGSMERVLQDDVDFMWSASLLHRCGNGAAGRLAGSPGVTPEAMERIRAPVT